MDISQYIMRMTDSHVYFVGGPLSQWFDSVFFAPLPALIREADGTLRLEKQGENRRFVTAEQAMMAAKASVFGDRAILEKILATENPARQKELGRKVQNFDAEIWNTVARTLVTRFNYAKFAWNNEIHNFLISTGTRELVEGAWYDRIWGVGLGWDDPQIEDRANWQGTNWLGEALMQVRSLLPVHGKQADPWAVIQEIT